MIKHKSWEIMMNKLTIDEIKPQKTQNQGWNGPQQIHRGWEIHDHMCQTKIINFSFKWMSWSFQLVSLEWMFSIGFKVKQLKIWMVICVKSSTWWSFQWTYWPFQLVSHGHGHEVWHKGCQFHQYKALTNAHHELDEYCGVWCKGISLHELLYFLCTSRS